jgi:molecular chaperone DnaK
VGAAIEAAVKAGDMKDILLLDVTPLTLGIKVEGGLLAPLIPRNTNIPTKRSQTFSTAADGQTGVTVEVFQGERPMADDNRKLGNFDLTGIPPAPRGVPKIEVSFDVDANGILNVTAKDQATGKEQAIRITASTGLREDEIQRMVRDSEQYAGQDRERKELAEARNQADHTIYATEKMLREQVDKGKAQDKEKIERAVESLKKAKESNRADEIRRAIDEVTRTSHEFSKNLYEEAARSQGPTPETAPQAEKPAGDEKVIDAEFRTKPDDRKAG